MSSEEELNALRACPSRIPCPAKSTRMKYRVQDHTASKEKSCVQGQEMKDLSPLKTLKPRPGVPAHIPADVDALGAALQSLTLQEIKISNKKDLKTQPDVAKEKPIYASKIPRFMQSNPDKDAARKQKIVSEWLKSNEETKFDEIIIDEPTSNYQPQMPSSNDKPTPKVSNKMSVEKVDDCKSKISLNKPTSNDSLEIISQMRMDTNPPNALLTSIASAEKVCASTKLVRAPVVSKHSSLTKDKPAFSSYSGVSKAPTSTQSSTSAQAPMPAQPPGLTLPYISAQRRIAAQSRTSAQLQEPRGVAPTRAVAQPRIAAQPKGVAQTRAVAQPRVAAQPKGLAPTRAVAQPHIAAQPKGVVQTRAMTQPRVAAQPRGTAQSRAVAQIRAVAPTRAQTPMVQNSGDSNAANGSKKMKTVSRLNFPRWAV